MTKTLAPDMGRLLGGRWRIVSPLGKGGQGHTFIARDENAPGVGERLVVVKRIRLTDGGWKRFDLFEREAKVLARLDHPGIPKFLGRVDGDDGTFYLLMARAPGDTLRDLSARKRFTEDELRLILAGVLDILVYLHGRDPPVVHRDIKPANILRAPDGTISLVDFGGVRAALADEDGGSTVVGTYGYMAPEQLHGEATPRTDLYGLAATIVALAAGVEPDKIPRRGLKMDLPRHLPQMSPALRSLLERMTDPDPDRRPDSAAEVKKLLGAPPRALAVVEPAPEPPAEHERPALSEDDWVAELDELRVPGPIRWVLRTFFGLVGIAGHLALALIALILVPVVFSVVRAFTGKEGDARLRETEGRVKGALRDTRRQFRLLQQRAFAPSRLPPRPERPRLPRRR